jgi:hypothetical protein
MTLLALAVYLSDPEISLGVAGLMLAIIIIEVQVQALYSLINKLENKLNGDISREGE